MSGKSKDFSMKKLLLALAVTSVLAACGKKEEATPAAPAAPASAPAAAAPAPEAGPLKVAIDPTYEPFTFKSADGQPTGFDVDIANALCEQIKRKCEFVEQVWDSMIPGLNAKKYDVIISSMSITDDRLKEVDFTDKYYNTPSRIVLKKGAKFTDAASIKGKKIGVLKGSTQEKYALGDLKPAGVIVNSYEAQDQVYLDIKSGRLDGTVADYMEVTGGFLSKPEGAKYELVGPDLKMPQYFGYGAGIALRKGEDKLKGELNEAIKAIRTNGTYKTLNDKYFAKYNIDVYGE
jgi:arginine/ornithine transport system substrate-binding protein